jgi:subtilisin-like proprotein convertase family protein
MKLTTSFISTVLGLICLVSTQAQAQTNFTYSSGTINVGVPDGNPVGVTRSTTLAGLSGYVSSVSVTLDITGGFNGDLYAYLADPNGNLAVLLNRVGVGSGNAFGYGDTGFNITLNSSAANNIHGYGSSYSVNGSGQVTGTWLADGRAINPQSSSSAFDTASTAANLSVFNNLIPNGQWTLFISDLSGGSSSTLVSWGMTIVTVPEPQTWALAVSGGVGLLLAMRRRRSRN